MRTAVNSIWSVAVTAKNTDYVFTNKMENVCNAQLDRKSVECDFRQMCFYEYNFTDWFTTVQTRIDRYPFTETLNYKLTLLNMESTWQIMEVEQNETGRLFSIKRRLEFIPFKESKKWSITIDLLDVLGVKGDLLSTSEQFKGMTADNENPCVEYELLVQETQLLKFFNRPSTDYFCRISISTVKCSGLSSYLSPSFDLSSCFDGSNVILDTGYSIPLYFVFELLAVHSPIFYEKWNSRERIPVDEDHYVIKLDMEERELKGLIPILKMIIYKKDYIHANNVESIAFVAKKWKFEMILAACEDFFIKRIDEDINKLNYLAQYYDMSQLQHDIWEYKEKRLEKLKDMEQKLAINNREVPTTREQTAYLEYITAEKFDLPEIATTFTTKNTMPMITPRAHCCCESTLKAFLEWKICWEYTPPGRVFLHVKPSFRSFKGEKRLFSSKNWSIHVLFTVYFNGKERKIDIIFSAKKKKETFLIDTKVENVDNFLFDYTIQTKIKCVKGLRYFVDDLELRSFDKKTPFSDIILQCSDKKLFVNLNIISLYSMFFKGVKDHPDMKTMDEEEQLPMVKMDDIDSSVVVLILNYIYSINRTPIAARHLESIIPVADRFLLNGLIHKCEQQLLNGPYHPLEIRTLDYVIKYNLYATKECYLKSFKSLTDFQLLKTDRNYEELSDGAKMLLYETMMNLPLEK